MTENVEHIIAFRRLVEKELALLGINPHISPALEAITRISEGAISYAGQFYKIVTKP